MCCEMRGDEERHLQQTAKRGEERAAQEREEEKMKAAAQNTLHHDMSCRREEKEAGEEGTASGAKKFDHDFLSFLSSNDKTQDKRQQQKVA